SSFTESFALLSEDAAEEYLSLLRKTLSGTPDKHLLDIPFTTAQVSNSAEHALLMRLKESKLEDSEAVKTLYEKILLSHKSQENYAILLGFNQYDVPFRGKDGREDENRSAEVFSFLTCAICPVKQGKAVLTYDPEKKSFRHTAGEGVISSPEAGFSFPSFDGRQTNLYDALFFTKSAADTHEALTQALFGSGISMPAETQKQVFHSILSESLEEACSFSVAKGVHDEIREVITEHKETKNPDPLTLSETRVKQILSQNGVTEEKVEEFALHYDREFGKGTDLAPRNIIDPGKFELKTPFVTVRVDPDHTSLVETRVIAGVKYVLIRVEEGVELNGLNVEIS
ncbi:MAG: DUF4317 domain-containing protein, partial [Clostridia bacterium]|nr:DUF4317 domain-containing protein [Clostridia bacterium]